MRQAALVWIIFMVLAGSVTGAQRPETELLLSGGTLYSLSRRTYRSLRLPEGWSVSAAAYSPDGRTLAVVLKGVHVPPAVEPAVAPPSLPKPMPVGPVNKTIRAWKPSTRLMVLDRSSGAVRRTGVLAAAGFEGDWTLSWTTATSIRATAHSSSSHPPADLVFNVNVGSPTSGADAVPPSVSIPPGDCPRTLAETLFQGKVLRFVKEAANCSTPPEPYDLYQLIHPAEASSTKDKILWEYRVPVSQTACAEPYACYTGADVQFLSVGERRYLVWDGDLFTIEETDDGIQAQLVTQLLPQLSHPWGMAAGETSLNPLDWEPAMPFQPVSEGLRISRGGVPVLYVQNFLPTRSFNATVEVGPYKKNVMVPAGTQVGPFKDRAYTPVLSHLRWTSFHHRADPIYCESPYTISPNTAGMAASITEDDKGKLQCQIRFEEGP